VGSIRIFLLPLPASFFKVLPLPQKFNRFHRFRIHAPRYMKNASASGSSKTQMLPRSPLPFPASFFKLLPLPQKFSGFHRFRLHIPLK